MTVTNLRRFGTHEAWAEEPDLYCMRFVGVIRGKEFREMLDLRNAWAAGRPSIFFLVDVSDATSVQPDVRQAMTEERAFGGPRRVTIAVGASFTIRVIGDMVQRAQRLLRPDRFQGDWTFVATETEARAFIEKRRREIVATTHGRTTP